MEFKTFVYFSMLILMLGTVALADTYYGIKKYKEVRLEILNGDYRK